MAGVVVSASKGVMDSVLSKLNDLVCDTCTNLTSVSKDILFLRDELTYMNTLLKKLEDSGQLDPLVKNWRNQVQELTYDIEDSIDDFKSNATSVNAKPSLVSKVSNFVINLRARLDTAMQNKDLKTRLHDISDRRKRYKIDDCTSGTTIEILDARLPALYNEADSLVGIANPKEELLNRLLDEDQKLKVVPIVGTGGLGKTTLANEVYHEVREHFSCKAFVPVSRTPDMLRILTSMLSQLHQLDEMPPAYDVQYLVNGLRTFLHNKRYLVIVDDLWDVPPWNIISCAFPQNNRQSRVVVTTRRVDVARACCSDYQYIHYMQPLSDTNSRKLFLKRVSMSEDDASHFESSESILCEILKKCGGLPLAIITIASIIAYQQPGRLKEQWESIQNSLAIQSAENPTLEEMMQILDLSYQSLPHHLKSCFLYLGKYPEDHEIRRDDLVRQWVAEGFVMCSPGRDVWEIAEGYFNGLVNRSMIQPIYESHFNNDVLCCRVHDMILDLILRRCGEDSFITVVCDPKEVAEAQYKVRRLSIDIRGAEDATMTIATIDLLSQVRSLSIFGGSNWVPPLLEFKFLRVLHHKFRWSQRRMDLTCISNLSQLRYLKVDGSDIVLPGQIQGLKFLETLELPKAHSSNIPSDIVELPRLSHLIVSCERGLPDGIGKAKTLCTLCFFSLLDSSLDSVVSLGKLTALSELRLECTAIRFNGYGPLLAALSASLEKLGNLKRLFVGHSYRFAISSRSYDASCVDDALMSWHSPPFRNLEQLGLEVWIFSSFS